MRKDQDSAVEALVEQLIEGGSENMATVFAGLFNLAMRIERERFLGAGHYERTPERRGYANGTRPKKIDTPAGTVRLEVPKTAGHEAPFYPQALERGRRSCRAVMLAVAEMYIKGVSTRDAEAVMREFGLESLSSSQVNRNGQPVSGEKLYCFLDAGCFASIQCQLDQSVEAVRYEIWVSNFGVRNNGHSVLLIPDMKKARNLVSTQVPPAMAAQIFEEPDLLRRNRWSSEMR